MLMTILRTALLAVLLMSTGAISAGVMAADYPAPRQGEWIAKDFKFHTGEVMSELRLHYTTLGKPRRDAQGRVDNAVLLLRAAGIVKGSAEPNRNKVGKVSKKQVEEIARLKLVDLNTTNIESAVRTVMGTARNMGLEVTA